MPYDSLYYVLIEETWPNGVKKYLLWSDGEELYFDQNKFFHRIDGPAIIFGNNTKEYWLHGQKCNSLEELIIKNIIE